MKLIVRERVTLIAEPVKKVYNITIDAINAYGKIPASIGLRKGDIIVFRGEGDPVRLNAGTVAGRVLTADPDSETGLAFLPGGGSGGGTVTLHNITGVAVPGGTVVKIYSGYDFIKATQADTSLLFVTGEDCAADADVVCYGTSNMVCSVRCTEDAVSVGDQLAVSSTDGVAEAVAEGGFCKALTGKASGAAGAVEAIIIQAGFLPISGGTMQGPITLASEGLKTPGVSGWKTDQYGNFQHQRNNANDSWNIKNNAGSGTVTIRYEDGVITKGVWNGTPVDVAHGGTGGTNAQAARNNLGASSGVWGLSVGGTGGVDSGWQALTNSSVFTGTIYYRKVGVFLYVYALGIKIVGGLSALSNVTLATMPAGYHPARDMVPACFQNNMNLAVRPLGCRIVGDGRIFVYTNNAALSEDNTIYLSGFCFVPV